MRQYGKRQRHGRKHARQGMKNNKSQQRLRASSDIHPFIVNNAFKVFFVFFIFFVFFVFFVDKEQCESNAQVDKRT